MNTFIRTEATLKTVKNKITIKKKKLNYTTYVNVVVSVADDVAFQRFQ